jgi:uncharacterized membrane protein
MADDIGPVKGQVQRPRPRIQSLSDLIFGLALSIGSLNLIANRPNDAASLFGNIASFGFSFLILIFVWFRYTEAMSVLPVETPRTRALNTALLFLVAIEPYLFNQLSFGLGATSLSNLPQDLASAAFGIDIGAIWVILASFTHILSMEERELVAPDLFLKHRFLRNVEIIVGAIFFVSILPEFWISALGGTTLRYILWAFTFLVRRTGNLYYQLTKKRKPVQLK